MKSKQSELNINKNQEIYAKEHITHAYIYIVNWTGQLKNKHSIFMQRNRSAIVNRECLPFVRSV